MAGLHETGKSILEAALDSEDLSNSPEVDESDKNDKNDDGDDDQIFTNSETDKSTSESRIAYFDETSTELNPTVPLDVEPKMLGFFATASDEEDKAISLKVVDHRNDEINPDEIITAPDGGWGWVIVFIAFLSNVFVDGSIYSFAFIQKDIIDLYKKVGKGEDKEVETIAWAGSLILGFNFLSGPLTSAAADRFGFRAGSMVGSFITGFAFIITACSADFQTGLPNLVVMLILYGIIAGTATGMIYMPSVVCVGYYFDKKRALAVGLAISGTGCGAFVFGLLSNWLIKSVGWRGTLLVEGCILFFCSVLGSLYRPLVADASVNDSFGELNKLSKRMRSVMAEMYQEEISGFEAGVPISTLWNETECESEANNIINKVCDDDGNISSKVLDAPQEELEKSSTSLSGIPLKASLTNPEIHRSSSSFSEKFHQRRQSDSSMPRDWGESMLMEILEMNAYEEDSNEEDETEVEFEETEEMENEHILSIEGFGIKIQGDEDEIPTLLLPSSRMINRPSLRPDAFLAGSLPITGDDVKTDMKYVYTNVPNNKSSTRQVKSGDTVTGDLRRRSKSKSDVTPSSSATTGYTEVTLTIPSETHVHMVDYYKPNRAVMIFRKLKSFRITSMPTFWIIALAGLLMTLGYPIPYIYLSELAITNNVDPELTSYLLSFMGMTNTLGRILCGYFSDSEKVNTLYVNNVSMIISGVVTFILPYAAVYGFYVCITYTILFGGSIACFSTLRSILIRDFIGIAGLATAFGLCLAFQGLAAIISSPMAVSMYKATGNYKLSFMVSGGLMISAAMLSFLLPYAHKRQLIWDAAEANSKKENLCRQRIPL